MAAQICESCKKKYESCYCSTNSTCENYETEDKGGVMGKFYGIPVSSDNDIVAGFERLGYSREEAEKLCELSKMPVTICTDIDIDYESNELAKMIDKFCEIGLPGEILTPEQVKKITEKV